MLPTNNNLHTVLTMRNELAHVVIITENGDEINAIYRQSKSFHVAGDSRPPLLHALGSIAVLFQQPCRNGWSL